MIIQDIYESAAATDRSVVDPIYTVVFNFDCSIPPADQNIPEVASAHTANNNDVCRSMQRA